MEVKTYNLVRTQDGELDVFDLLNRHGGVGFSKRHVVCEQKAA